MMNDDELRLRACFRDEMDFRNDNQVRKQINNELAQAELP